MVEYITNHDCFHRLDLQPFLYGIGTAFYRDSAIAIYRGASIPVALSSILFHSPKHMLGVLPALIFVEHGAELTEHFT